MAVDIDGTLGDYHGHFINFAEEYLGVMTFHRDPKSPFQYDGTEPYREWFCRTYQVDLRTYRDIKLAYRQGGMKRSMRPYPDAKVFVDGLRAQEVEVWITTTRPYQRLDNIDPDTRAWLERQRIEFDGMLYDEDKYERLAELVDRDRVVGVLDDLPEQYDAAARLFGEGVPIFRKNVYNRNVVRMAAVRTLLDAAFVLRHAIRRWDARMEAGEVV